MKIDAVITWVDGNDPAHRAKRNKYASADMLISDDVAGDTRFVEVGEIAWCVASINRFAPWVNKIYIVTDAQDPKLEPFMKSNFPQGYIPMEIVDHKVIYSGYEQYLPTFNACSIESMTWRIPGLSDRFLSFNDDMMLCAPVSPEDFFTEDDKSICYAGKANLPFTVLTRKLKPVRNGHKKVTFKGALANAALLAGNRWSFLRINHTPRALRRDFYEAYFTEHPDALIRNVQYRFRDSDMYVPELLQYSLLQIRDKCEVRPVKGNLFYVQPNGKDGYIQSKLKTLASGNYKFCCFNSIDKAAQEELMAVKQWVMTTLDIKL